MRPLTAKRVESPRQPNTGAERRSTTRRKVVIRAPRETASALVITQGPCGVLNKSPAKCNDGPAHRRKRSATQAVPDIAFDERRELHRLRVAVPKIQRRPGRDYRCRS